MIIRDIDYLPKPNVVELVLSSEPAPADLTTTSFGIPVRDDGAVVLAFNQDRGVEIAGGHIEPGETPEQAAGREVAEEINCEIDDLRPIGYLKMTVHAKVPDDYRYPYPVSYQQFYAGRLKTIAPYIDNSECGQPLICRSYSGTKPTTEVFVREAQRIFT